MTSFTLQSPSFSCSRGACCSRPSLLIVPDSRMPVKISSRIAYRPFITNCTKNPVFVSSFTSVTPQNRCLQCLNYRNHGRLALGDGTQGQTEQSSFERMSFSESFKVMIKCGVVLAAAVCGVLVFQCQRATAVEGAVNKTYDVVEHSMLLLKNAWPKILQLLQVIRDQGLVLAALLGLSAFFSMAETSITTLWPWKVRELAEKEPDNGVFRMLRSDVTRFLTTILIGTTVVNIAATALVTEAATAIFGEAGISAATGVMTVAILLLTEITPKSIAVHHATDVARLVVRPVAWLSVVLYPVGRVATFLSFGMLKMLGFKGRRNYVPDTRIRISIGYLSPCPCNIGLDSPAGVGFSYSADKSFYDNINDDITARDNIRFLEEWIAKHPKYVNRDVFIAGESYGGHFVPQLANLVLESSLKWNLKGILIGNPLLEFDTDMNLRAIYMWSHGVISDSTFEMLNKECNYSRMHREYFRNNSLSPPCDEVNMQADFEWGKSIDMYDISLGLCYGASLTWRFLTPKTGVDLCIADKTTAYLNRADVQKALHGKIGEWDICTRVGRYNMRELEITSLPYIATLIQSHIRVLVYSGDQDAVLPFIGSRLLVNRLAEGLRLNKTQPYEPWLYGKKKAGGWTEEFGGLLSFATIRGAGHEAPFTQPEKSLALLRKFVRGIPLA